MDAVAEAFCSEVQQNVPSWGLARVSQLGSVDNGKNTYYSYNLQDGSGVDIYVLDTGIYCNHPDFRGRCTWGANFIPGSGDEDVNGHGTACAGVAAGSILGISKQSHLYAVKVLGDNGSGTFAQIVSGVNWVQSRHESNQRPSVVLMALGGGTESAAMRTAIENAVNAGVFFAAAAGGSNANTCNSYPAGYPFVFGVGASDENDNRASYSNYGPCTKVYAPGSLITTAWPDGSTITISGTSMSCAHAAGQAAVVLSTNPSYTPSQLSDALVASAQKGILKNIPNGPNNLLYNGCGTK